MRICRKSTIALDNDVDRQTKPRCEREKIETSSVPMRFLIIFNEVSCRTPRPCVGMFGRMKRKLDSGCVLVRSAREKRVLSYKEHRQKSARVRKSASPHPSPRVNPRSYTLEYANECSIFQEHYVYRSRGPLSLSLSHSHPLRTRVRSRPRPSDEAGCVTTTSAKGMGQTDTALSLTLA